MKLLSQVLFSAVFTLVSLSAFCQRKFHLLPFFELATGHYGQELVNEGAYFETSLNLNLMLESGVEFRGAKTAHEIGFFYSSLSMPDHPRWNYGIFAKVHSGSNFSPIYGLAYRYNRKIFENSNFYLSTFLGCEVGIVQQFIGYNKDLSIEDRLSQGLFETFDGRTGERMLVVQSYQEPSSLFASSAHFGFKVDYKVSKSVIVSVIPTLKVGLHDFYQSDFFYDDIFHNTNGHGVILVDGDWIGIKCRLSYNLTKKKKPVLG